MQAPAGDRPLHVLGRAEERFDPAHGLGHLPDLTVVQRRAAGLPGCDGGGCDAVRRCGRNPVRAGLGGNLPLDDAPGSVDVMQVAVGLARDHRGGQPVIGGDDGKRAIPRDRVGAEGDTGGVRLDHPLDDDGGGGRRPGQPLLRTIGAHGRAEAGFPDRGHAPRDLRRPDPQKALELTREGVRRTVLVRRRGANGEQGLGGAEP